MAKRKMMSGMMLNSRIRGGGLTFYVRDGQSVVRVAHSQQPRRMTRKQFIQRQRMRHTTALWKNMKYCQPMFLGGASSYARFASLSNNMQPVFMEKNFSTASLLMPGIPVSDGTLNSIEQRLGEVNGTPALITNLKKSDLGKFDVLKLYYAYQIVGQHNIEVLFSMREVALNELHEEDGYIVLFNNDFADEMKGWALVRESGDNCSQQSIITPCTYYQQYTTEEALKAAAKTYGGLTRDRT